MPHPARVKDAEQLLARCTDPPPPTNREVVLRGTLFTAIMIQWKRNPRALPEPLRTAVLVDTPTMSAFAEGAAALLAANPGEWLDDVVEAMGELDEFA